MAKNRGSECNITIPIQNENVNTEFMEMTPNNLGQDTTQKSNESCCMGKNDKNATHHRKLNDIRMELNDKIYLDSETNFLAYKKDNGSINEKNFKRNRQGDIDETEILHDLGIFHRLKRACWWFKRYGSYCIKSILIIAYFAYFGYALFLSVEKSRDLIVLTSLVVIYKTTKNKHFLRLCGKIKRCFCQKRSDSDRSLDMMVATDRDSEDRRKRNCIQIALQYFYVPCFLALMAHLGYEVYLNPKSKAPPMIGFFFMIALGIVFSRNVKKINWRTVITGIVIQISAAECVYKLGFGSQAFQYIGEKMDQLMTTVDEGARFCFGDNFKDHNYAFKAMPVVIFLSALISVALYLGILEWVIKHGSFIFRYSMQTSKIESLCAISNIFLGQVEALMLFKDYIADLTLSEMQSVVMSGMSTISGTNYALYLTFGIDSISLINANIMAAPASLYMSKILLPEMENPVIEENNVGIKKGTEKNIIEAFSNGAMAAVPLVGSILANMIVFISILTLLNNMFSWFFGHAGYGYLNFEGLLSYVFLPIVWLIGIPIPELSLVGRLLGKKLVANEFLAYVDLDKFRDQFSPRALVITTYALCGFTNFGSIGCQFGTLSHLAPSKRSDISKIALKGLFGAFLVNLMNSCIIAILYNGP